MPCRASISNSGHAIRRCPAAQIIVSQSPTRSALKQTARAASADVEPLSIAAAPSWGIAAVIVASVIGQALGSTYLLLASRALPERVPSPLRFVPWFPVLAAAAASAASVSAMQWAIERFGLPGGGVGLVLCGLAAAPALVGYGAATIGLRRCVGLVRRRGRL